MTDQQAQPKDEIAELLEEMKHDLDQGMVPSRIFNDPVLHQLERKKIFSRAWCFIGHEAEIASPGDYHLRYIAQDRFIFIRGEDGVARVIWDSCRHRGQQICRAERGNTSHLRCSYHGWTYKNTGEFVTAPGFTDIYPGLEHKDWGLLSAPRVESYHGYVFASLDPDAVPLEEFLGDFTWYLDIMSAFEPDQWEPIAEGMHWVNDGNWKSGVENASGDDYHLITLHKSSFSAGLFSEGEEVGQFKMNWDNITHIQLGNGHSLTLHVADEKVRSLSEDARRSLSPEQIELAERLQYMLGVIFPNAMMGGMARADGNMTMSTALFSPRPTPNKMEQWRWVFTRKGTTDEAKLKIWQEFVARGGAAGTVTQDDPEPWAAISHTGSAMMTRATKFKLNFQMGLPGVGPARRLEDWSLPGVAIRPCFEESGQRSYYRTYLHYMTSEEFPSTISSDEAATAALARDLTGPVAPEDLDVSTFQQRKKGLR